MASSSSLASSHDVFPSFRGKDVRRTFLSHLLNEFQRRRITIFVDNDISSKTIFPELVRAIKASRIFIVILSKNYASSSWCLNELLEIMKCKDSKKQMVMPIFYDVDPSDVRYQIGDFGKGFERTCLGKTEDEKERWKKALIYVADISGVHSRNWCVLLSHSIITNLNCFENFMNGDTAFLCVDVYKSLESILMQ